MGFIGNPTNTNYFDVIPLSVLRHSYWLVSYSVTPSCPDSNLSVPQCCNYAQKEAEAEEAGEEANE